MCWSACHRDKEAPKHKPVRTAIGQKGMPRADSRPHQGSRLMRCLVASCFGLALLVAVCGCRHCDHVESELRGRENEVRELRDELDRSGIYNLTLQQELRSLRGEL